VAAGFGWDWPNVVLEVLGFAACVSLCRVWWNGRHKRLSLSPYRGQKCLVLLVKPIRGDRERWADWAKRIATEQELSGLWRKQRLFCPYCQAEVLGEFAAIAFRCRNCDEPIRLTTPVGGILPFFVVGLPWLAACFLGFHGWKLWLCTCLLWWPVGHPISCLIKAFFLKCEPSELRPFPLAKME